MYSFDRKIFWFKRVKRILTDFFVSLKNKFTKKHTKTDLDKRLVYSLSGSKIPNTKQIKYVGKFLSKREVWIIRILVLVILVNVGMLGYNFYKNNLEVVPKQDGTYVEGLIGNPQYVNPIYAPISDVDSDISQLVFSGLFKKNEEGKLVKDLAKEYEVGPKNKIYNIKLKENVKWHSGESFTAEDVIFTFRAIKNKNYNSPLQSKFTNVEIEKVNNHEVKIVTPKSSPNFLADLRFGIMPKFMWSQISPNTAKLAELNLKPIGTGPYKFESLIKDTYGNVLEYKLTVNEKYYSKEPYIENLHFKFFVSPEEAIGALNKNEIDGIGYVSRENMDDLVAKNSLNTHSLSLPKINSVFFNKENNPYLDNLKIRQVLALSIDKKEIVNEVFDGGADPMNTPLPSFAHSYADEIKDYRHNSKEAERILKEEGWESFEIKKEEIDEIKKIKQEDATTTATATPEGGEGQEDDSEEIELSEEQKDKLLLGKGEWMVKKSEDEEDQYLLIELTYPDKEDYSAVAHKIKEYWESVGVKTILRPIEVGNFGERVLKDRSFQALLYAQAFNLQPDLSSFWHSSSIEDGFNISGYQNKQVDKLLEEAETLNPYSEEKREKYVQVQKKIIGDSPAIILYSPNYNYIQSKKIKGFGLEHIINPNDRFVGIEDWYIKTGKKIKW